MKANQQLQKIAVVTNTDPRYKNRRSTWAVNIERYFYRYKNQLVFIHAAMFLFFLALMILPLFTALPDVHATLWNNLRLFSAFLFWGLWFPLVFASVIFAGRLWCGVLCPMGAASEWANKVGFQWVIPRWLRWEGTPILSFLLITILGQTVDVRDEASAMLEIFGGTLVLALIIGFFFGRQKRAWCRHACPIGLLLGVFSRLGIVQLSPKIPHSQTDRYADRGICPTMIDINHKAESRHCIQCFRCVKPTSPGGLFLRFRKAGEEVINIRQHNPNITEIWFIFLGTGIALGGFLWLILPQYQNIRQIIGEWFINHGWYWIGNNGPAWLMSVHPAQHQAYNWLDFFMIVGFMLSCMVYSLIILSTTNIACSWIAGKFGGDGTLKQRFTELGYQFTPVAMLSIILGLGDLLFQQFAQWGIHPAILQSSKIVLFSASLLWGLYLGYHILKRQSVSLSGRMLALLPALLGSLLIALSWWPAVFGIDYSMLESYRTHLLILN